MTAPTAAVTAELLAKYDRPGPRYTSYPTAVEFHDGFTPQRYLEKLDGAASSPDEPLSIYLHLPFCEERCTFCACNVIIGRKENLASDYLDDVEREVGLVARRLGRRRVAQFHWGGGTPTFLTPQEIERTWKIFARQFGLEPGAEVAIEVDPRVTSPEQAKLLRTLGFNRISLGVQDFTPEVQAAVNRHQTFEQTKALYDRFRSLGFDSINFDLIYGLPLQTPESFGASLERVLALRPDRIACYSYAFVPWIKGQQKGNPPETLPPPEMKFQLFGLAHERFIAAGYEQIGMDHFALSTDSLARAARERTLFRNFQGYTTHPAKETIGFGVSAIGDVNGAFAQNTKRLTVYHDLLDRGLPPVERGYERTADDAVRRDVIQNLMCNFHLDVRAVERAHGIKFAAHFAEALAELAEGPAASGFVEIGPDEIRVTTTGRLFIRNICMAFDAHLKKRTGDKPVFSRTV